MSKLVAAHSTEERNSTDESDRESHTTSMCSLTPPLRLKSDTQDRSVTPPPRFKSDKCFEQDRSVTPPPRLKSDMPSEQDRSVTPPPRFRSTTPPPPEFKSDTKLHELKKKFSKLEASHQSRKTRISDEDLEKLILRIIDMFKKQAAEGDQFAVLLLMEDNNFDVKFRTKMETVSSAAEATNNEYPIYPPDSITYNYICARPDKSDPSNTIHTELQLLGKLDLLLENYRSCGHNCKFILLYTWLLPCLHCKNEIIKILHSSGKYKSYKVILAYTSAINYTKKTGSYAKDIGMPKQRVENDFKLAGIKVIQVREKGIDLAQLCEMNMVPS